MPTSTTHYRTNKPQPMNTISTHHTAKFTSSQATPQTAYVYNQHTTHALPNLGSLSKTLPNLGSLYTYNSSITFSGYIYTYFQNFMEPLKETDYIFAHQKRGAITTYQSMHCHLYWSKQFVKQPSKTLWRDNYQPLTVQYNHMVMQQYLTTIWPQMAMEEVYIDLSQ